MRRLSAPALLLLLAALPLGARTLTWDALHVEAHLDADGRLRVRETHVMRFDGDWNGGERSFRVEPDQEFKFHSIVRIAGNGREVPLAMGSLDRVDSAEFVSKHTLRWRSRLPSDPPFRDRSLTYAITYTLSQILQPREDVYVLDHDFAFRDRPGTIKDFRLNLSFHPVWRVAQGEIPTIERTRLPPGETVEMEVRLVYTGPGKPSSVPRDWTSRRRAVGLLFGLLSVFVLRFLWKEFLRHQASVQRFAPLPPVSRAWLEDTLLKLRAEIVGAAWDRSVSENEVAALLARLVAEQKIESRVSTGFGPPEMAMTLLVPRDQFQGYERALIELLFFNGDRTSTSAVRSHYQATGFDPAATVSEGILAETRALTPSEPLPSVRVWPSLILGVLSFLVSAVVFIATKVDPARFPLALVAVAPAGALIFGIHMWRAFVWRRDVGSLNQARRLLRTPGLLLIVGVALMLIATSFFFVSGFLLAYGALLVASIGFDVAKAREGIEATRLRRMIALARSHFRRELEKPSPNLEDSWFPYLVALGLGPQVDFWFRRIATPSASSGSSTRPNLDSGSSRSASSASQSGPGWTGGGGAFGGAGASGTWSYAVGSLAAGVSPPSSGGGSSGGGGGGGSSSGGGGGGGW